MSILYQILTKLYISTKSNDFSPNGFGYYFVIQKIITVKT